MTVNVSGNSETWKMIDEAPWRTTELKPMNEDLHWTTQTRKISDLKQFEKNPRQLSKQELEQLTKSIEKFGYVEIVVIDTDNTILAGHMRVRVLKKHKVKEIEVRVPNRPLTEQEREQYVINSNLIHGSFDYDILANEWNAEDLVSYGFNTEDLFSGITEDKPKKKTKKKSKQHECPECGCKFTD